jgi:hypothetical protein
MDISKLFECKSAVISNDLDIFMNKMASDKGSNWHNYTIVYHTLFEPIRNSPIHLFELGLGTNNINIPSNMGPNGKPGASLYAWSDYFKNAKIYGADVDKDILFQDEEKRIQSFYCDQMDTESISNLWKHKEIRDIQFDIIIDDGLHEVTTSKLFFEYSYHKVAKGGIFIIEDIHKSRVLFYNNQIASWKEKYSEFTFCFFEVRAMTTQPHDNWMLIAQRMN